MEEKIKEIVDKVFASRGSDCGRPENDILIGFKRRELTEALQKAYDAGYAQGARDWRG